MPPRTLLVLFSIYLDFTSSIDFDSTFSVLQSQSIEQAGGACFLLYCQMANEVAEIINSTIAIFSAYKAMVARIPAPPTMPIIGNAQQSAHSPIPNNPMFLASFPGSFAIVFIFVSLYFSFTFKYTTWTIVHGQGKYSKTFTHADWRTIKTHRLFARYHPVL